MVRIWQDVSGHIEQQRDDLSCTDKFFIVAFIVKYIHRCSQVEFEGVQITYINMLKPNEGTEFGYCMGT